MQPCNSLSVHRTQALSTSFAASTGPCGMDVTDLGASTTFAPGVPPGSTVWDMPDDDTMLQQISAMLQQLCDHNAAHLGACPTIFDSVAPPLLLPSVHCFLVRIHCYTEFDSVCFLIALSLIMRLRGEHGPSLRPTTHNIHRLFIAALVVASKTNDGAPRRAPPLVVYHMLTTGPHANPTTGMPNSFQSPYAALRLR